MRGGPRTEEFSTWWVEGEAPLSRPCYRLLHGRALGHGCWPALVRATGGALTAEFSAPRSSARRPVPFTPPENTNGAIHRRPGGANGAVGSSRSLPPGPRKERLPRRPTNGNNPHGVVSCMVAASTSYAADPGPVPQAVTQRSGDPAGTGPRAHRASPVHGPKKVTRLELWRHGCGGGATRRERAPQRGVPQ